MVRRDGKVRFRKNGLVLGKMVSFRIRKDG